MVQFGRLVQRQTEILLRESPFQRTRLLRENRFAQPAPRHRSRSTRGWWTTGSCRASGLELGYDLVAPRVAVVFEVQPGPETYPSSVRAIVTMLGPRLDIVAELSAGRYVVLHHPSSEDADHLRSGRSSRRRASARPPRRRRAHRHRRKRLGYSRFGGFLR